MIMLNANFSPAAIPRDCLGDNIQRQVNRCTWRWTLKAASRSVATKPHFASLFSSLCSLTMGKHIIWWDSQLRGKCNYTKSVSLCKCSSPVRVHRQAKPLVRGGRAPQRISLQNNPFRFHDLPQSSFTMFYACLCDTFNYCLLCPIEPASFCPLFAFYSLALINCGRSSCLRANVINTNVWNASRNETVR